MVEDYLFDKTIILYMNYYIETYLIDIVLGRYTVTFTIQEK
jgi:hypothetical protein